MCVYKEKQPGQTQFFCRAITESHNNPQFSPRVFGVINTSDLHVLWQEEGSFADVLRTCGNGTEKLHVSFRKICGSIVTMKARCGFTKMLPSKQTKVHGIRGRKGLCWWMQKRAAFSDDRRLHGYLGNPRRHPAGDASVSPWNYVICWLTCVWQRPGWSRCRRISGNLISRRCHAAALMSRSGRLGAVMLSWCARIFRGVNDSANNSLIPQIFRNIVILA